MKQNKRIRTINGYAAKMSKPSSSVYVGQLPDGDLEIVLRRRNKEGRQTHRLRLSPEAWGALYYCGCLALRIDAAHFGYKTAVKIAWQEKNEQTKAATP